MNETEIMNQFASNDMWFGYTVWWPIVIIIQLVVYLLMWWGLYNINKKLWEPNPWVSWIPVINIYSLVRASWKPNIWILWLVLWAISMIIPILWLILFLVLYFTVLNWISRRTWNWVWTTIWFFFLWFIFFPLVGYKFDPKNEVKIENLKNNKNKEDKKNIDL